MHLLHSKAKFGDYARWHSHLHALVADGLFLESGYFFCDAEDEYPAAHRIIPRSCFKDVEKREADR